MMEGNNLIEKLKVIQGKELKYKQLCEALALPIQTSDSKKAQFNNLAIYCDIETLEHPKRYIVKEVYEEELKVLELLSSNNKFQLLFEVAIYKAFLDNNCEPIYLSNLDSLKLFQEVNDNFSYACSYDCMMLVNEEYSYMPDMGLTIYRILTQWTKRRLEAMKYRGSIMIRDCFRLYKKRSYNGKEYTSSLDVPINSLYEKYCQEIYYQAVNEVMPKDWGNENKGRYWVPEWQWRKFELRIKELTKEKFNGNYDNMKPILMVTCPTSEWVQKKTAQLCNELNALQEINEESCRKVMDSKSTQMDSITQRQRKEFIEINMKPNPPINFKGLLHNIEKSPTN